MEGKEEDLSALPHSNVISKAESSSSTVHNKNLRNSSTTAVQPSSGTVVVGSATATAATTTGQLIKTANGQTVVLTGGPLATTGATTSVVTPFTAVTTNHLQNNSNSKVQSSVAQALSVSGGGMSIVQFQLSNQSNMVQSVIQPNHQSVIQAAPNQTSISALAQLPKNHLILLNKVPGTGSVIQSTEPGIQLSKETDTEVVNQTNYDDESKRRREILARRPSYRKIFSELSSTEATTVGNSVAEGKSEEDSSSPSSQQPAISLSSYLKVLPASAIQIGAQDGSTIQGIPTIMTNTNTGSSTIVQYATSGHDGQFIVPADLQTYQLRPNNTPQNVVMASTNLSTQIIDDASKKRELRLLKNREAAKECRRKKKEYIKCLENRVTVLENQNKALIDELKTLKELYCKKPE